MKPGRIRLLAAGIFAALSLWGAVASEGFLEADGCMHFLYARDVWHEPTLLADVWGRPVVTALYALPALLGGRLGVRIMSLLIALATAELTFRIARRLKLWRPEFTFVFLLASPLVFLHSFSELTELPFALLVAGAFLAYQARQWLVLALLAGLMPAARPEGFGLLLLAGLGLWFYRRRWLAVLIVPLIAWNLGGWWLYGCDGSAWRWLIDHWPWAATSSYDSGPIWHFLVLLPVLTGPLIFPAVIAGVRVLVAQAKIKRATKNTKNRIDLCVLCDLCGSTPVLVVALPVAVLIVHSLLYWQGKMASNGEPRYLLTVAPFWAILAAAGFAWLTQRLHLRRPGAWVAVAALAPILSHWIYPILPLKLQPDWVEARDIAAWYRTAPLRDTYPRLAVAHPAVIYFLDDPRQPREHWTTRTAAHPPPGTLLVWDRLYAVYNADGGRIVTAAQLEAGGWLRINPPLPLSDAWRLYVSPQPQTR